MDTTSQGGTPATPVDTNTAAKDAAQKPTGEATPQAGGAQAGATKAAAAEAMRRLKIGEEEVDEAEVIKVYQSRKSHQQAANKELQEGKKLRRQNEEFIAKMKDKATLFDVIKKLGHDPRQLSEEFLASVLEEEMLDPREKELKSAKARLKAYEDLEKKQKEAKQKEADDQMKRKFSEDYSKQFIDALKVTGLPPTKKMVAEMASYIKRAADLKFEMTAEEAAKLVKDDQETHYRNLYGEADPETLARLLGDAGLQKVRTYDTAKIKDPAAQLKTPEEQGESRKKRDNTKRMTPQQWREFNRK